jgi:hypothetical protein
MLGEESAIPAAKVATATVAGAGAASASLFGFDHYIVAFVGVPFTSVGMAAAGAMLSFAFGKGEPNRFKLFATAVGATFIGAAAITFVPEFFHLRPVTESARPVVGFFYALFTRWGMPVLIDVVPMLLRRWFNIPAKTEGEVK